MSKGPIVEVPIDKLIKHSIPIEGFLVLYCIYLEKQEILGQYVSKAGSISLKLVNFLASQGYLILPDTGEINTKTLKITDKFKINFIEDIIGLDFEQCLSELRATYLKKVRTKEGGERYLQPDPKLIKELYRKALVKKGILDLELHKTVLKCVKFQIWKYEKDGISWQWMQLTRYLRHQNWEQFIEEAKNWKEETIKTNNGAEVI